MDTLRPQSDSSERQPDRRRFLQAMSAVTLGGVAATLSSCSAKKSVEPATTAADFFQRFPRQLSVGSVEKFQEHGARRCIVHIRQFHDTSIPLRGTMNKEDELCLENVQAEIAEMLDELIRDPGIALKKVYAEGSSFQGDAFPFLSESFDHEAVIQEIRAELAHRKASLLKGSSDAASMERMRQSIAMLEGMLSDPRRSFEAWRAGEIERHTRFDALFRLRDRLQILPAEDQYAHECALTALLQTNQELRRQVVEEDRENAFLRIASQSDDIGYVVVFGAAHDWRNNIDQWNAEHPDDRYSLIVVTPHTVRWRNVVGGDVQ